MLALVTRYLLLPSSHYVEGEVGSDVHALLNELAIRRVEHKSGIHSNESQHLAEGTEVTRLRRRFSFVLEEKLLFRTRYHVCRQSVALAGTQQLRSQGPVSIHVYCTEGPGPRDGKERARSGGGSDTGTGTETVAKSGTGTGT